MHPADRRLMLVVLCLLFPVMTWMMTINLLELKFVSLADAVYASLQSPLLLFSFILGCLGSAGLFWTYQYYQSGGFKGAPFRTHLRGTRIVKATKLKRLTGEQSHQISIANIPMPTQLENLHLLVNGATGTGKTVLLRELVYSALSRGDRMIIIDPNGDMLSQFYRPNDVILNSYDRRSEGWSIFNEVRHDFDFQRYALSLVPRGRTPEAEEWAGYSRLLLRETARKLSMTGKPFIRELFRWTTMASYNDLKAFLSGTLAEALFTGAKETSRALTSARFILSDKLPEHVTMPDGVFSIREWLEWKNGGSLFMTWREDMALPLRPLISCWVDVVCTSLLSLPEDQNRRIWLIIDELAALDKLASLEDALTRGRKAGLRVVAGLQSTSQLDDIYGPNGSQTIRSCFRSLVVLGGSRADPKTSEDMSLSLGDHEVERLRFSRNHSDFLHNGRDSVSETTEWVKERAVSAAEISNLPELTAYVSFAGDYPIAQTRLEPLSFQSRVPAFVERKRLDAQS